MAASVAIAQGMKRTEQFTNIVVAFGLGRVFFVLCLSRLRSFSLSLSHSHNLLSVSMPLILSRGLRSPKTTSPPFLLWLLWRASQMEACGGCKSLLNSPDPVSGTPPRRWLSRHGKAIGGACYYCFRTHKTRFLSKGITWTQLVTKLHPSASAPESGDVSIQKQLWYHMNRLISSHQMGLGRSCILSDHESNSGSDDMESVAGSALTSPAASVASPASTKGSDGVQMTWVPHDQYMKVYQTYHVGRDRFQCKNGQMGFLTPRQDWDIAMAASPKAKVAASVEVVVAQSARKRASLIFFQ